MATKIKLMRLGKMRSPYYRIVIADARKKRDGRVIETIGKYHPKQDPSFIEVDAERAAYWLGVGAQPTDPVQRLLKVTGDWQRFTGEPAPSPMLTPTPKADRKAAFEAAALEGVTTAKGAATTPATKKAPKKDSLPEAPKASAEAASEEPSGAGTQPAQTGSQEAMAAAQADAPQASVEPEAVATAPEAKADDAAGNNKADAADNSEADNSKADAAKGADVE